MGPGPITIVTLFALGAPGPAVVIFGGGWGPAGQQASIELQTQSLARALAPAQPHVLFGNNKRTVRSVQTISDIEEVDDLLALLFERPDALHVTYRPPQLKAAGPADRTHLLDALERTRGHESGTIVFGVGHGAPGDEHRGASLELWGSREDALTIEQLVEDLNRGKRTGPLAMVLGQCFSGAFTDLSYRTAEPGLDVARPARCVFAAIPRDREASGCTADLNDPAARSYMHLVATALSDRTADLDQDARVSLEEAHAYARRFDSTINVPVSSSETFLLNQKLPGGEHLADDKTLPWLMKNASASERTVLEALRPNGISRTGRVQDVLASQKALDSRARAADEALVELEHQLARTIYEIRAHLFERWPELSNPFHHRSRTLLAGDAAEVIEAAKAHPRFESLMRIREVVSRRGNAMLELDRQLARYERWLRAAEKTARRAALRAGKDRRRKEALEHIEACESMVPISVSKKKPGAR